MIANSPNCRDAAAAIQARARQVVSEFCSQPLQRQAMIDLLSRPGYALDPTAECRAGQLALEVYCAVAGNRDDLAVELGAAVELHMEAACFFDDVADAPKTGQAETGELLALAISLLACGNMLASRVATRAAGPRGEEPLIELHRNCLTASGGQFLDARFEGRSDVSPQEALDMTCRKSGTLGRSAAGFGVRLATDEADTIRRFESLGHDIFTYAQLIDDLRDACPAEGSTDDFDQGKKTVPLNFFYRHQRSRSAAAADDTIDDRVDFRRDYVDSGAALYGAMLAEVFWNRAGDTVRELEHLGFPLERVAAMMARLEGGSADAVVTARLADEESR